MGLQAEYPLHIVQMDQTKADLLIVDSVDRQEAQRPWLTFAIDLYSRCIVGYHVSVEAPSATPVAICLASVAEDKRKILEKHKIDADWPISGKPAILHTDNGKEFKSKALRAGCLLHGIEIQYRPVARPHYGGVVERVMRTFMAKIHDEIPGTTRSNIKERGKYPAGKLACMTRDEFEEWLLWAIADYHASVHRSLGEPPIERLRYGLEHVQRPTPVANPKAAAAHHRLLWLHPFLDGNGRVARLMSHAMFREFGPVGELWAVARGLARTVKTYEARLSAADEPRRGDLDGRGCLSDEGLFAFCKYFLEVARDQVAFMHTLLARDELWARVKVWSGEEMEMNRLPPRSDLVLRAVVRDGSMTRGEAALVTGYSERQARTILTALVARGVLLSDTPRGDVRLGFAPDVVERWLPRLYPAAIADAAE